MNLRNLRVPRTAVLTVAGLGAIVAGLWVVAAVLFGAAIGAGAGIALGGVALLLIEAASDEPEHRPRQ